MNIFIGYDSREDLAYQVCSYSIKSKSKLAKIFPLKLNELRSKGLYKRDEDKLGSTEFTFSRFLVPVLNDYTGWALFCDCDILFLNSVEELFSQADDKYAVMCETIILQRRYEMDGEFNPFTQEKLSSLYCGTVVILKQKINTELVNDPKVTENSPF